jgi:hypothetical protein
MRRLVTSALVGIEYHLVHRFCDSKARHNPLSCPALCTGCSLQYTPEVRNVLSALASHLNKNIPVWTGMLAADLSDDVVHFAIVSPTPPSTFRLPPDWD